MIDFSKPYHLTGFRLVVVIIIAALLIGLFLRFAGVIQASMEEISIELNLMSMQQMVRDQNLMSKDQDQQCKYLDNPDLFLFVSNPMAESTPDKQTPGSWAYDNKSHQLTYFVRSTDYFRSKFGHKIVLDLYCKQGVVVFKKSPFQWCHDKRIWGCGDW